MPRSPVSPCLSCGHRKGYRRGVCKSCEASILGGLLPDVRPPPSPRRHRNPLLTDDEARAARMAATEARGKALAAEREARQHDHLPPADVDDADTDARVMPHADPYYDLPW